MRTISAFIVTVTIVVTTARVPLQAGKRPRIEGRRLEAPVTIDGSDKDWPGPLLKFGDQPLSIAAATDAEYLYLVLTTRDPAARAQVLRQGLIVWFDGKGGDKRRFGIKYPVGGFGSDARAGGAGRRGRGAPPDAPGDKESVDQYEPPDRLEILSDHKDDERTFVLDKVPGIAVKLGRVEGAMVYELKVPLAKTPSHPYAVNAERGASIGVGVEVPKMEQSNDERTRIPAGGGMRGGRGGMGRRRGGGGGGRTGSDRATRKPLKGWVTIDLLR